MGISVLINLQVASFFTDLRVRDCETKCLQAYCVNNKQLLSLSVLICGFSFPQNAQVFEGGGFCRRLKGMLHNTVRS